MKLLERALIRCEVRLRFTEGFNPRLKFTASPAIPLGMSSRSEYLQFEAFGDLPTLLPAQLNDCLIEGLEIKKVEVVEPGSGKKMTKPLQATYRAWLPGEIPTAAQSEVTDLQGRVYDLINHLADHDRGNAFYCSSAEHARISDLVVTRENPLELSFTLSINPDTGSLMRAKDFLGQVLGCSQSLVSQFQITKESLSFHRSVGTRKPLSPSVSERELLNSGPYPH